MNAIAGADRLSRPEIVLIYGQARSHLEDSALLFQWGCGNRKRIQVVEDITAAQKALIELKNQPFAPVMVFDAGESCKILDIARPDLPDFEIVDAEEYPEQAANLLHNPEAGVEEIWLNLYQGRTLEPATEPWSQPDFSLAYGSAFLEWLRRHDEDSLPEPQYPLHLNDFVASDRPEDARLIHRAFPMAWLSVVHHKHGRCAMPGGVLAAVAADDLELVWWNGIYSVRQLPPDALLPHPIDREIDQLFDWLRTMPRSSQPDPPPPDQELLDLAWQAAQAHRRLFGSGPYRETIMPLAASDGSHKNAPLRFDLPGGGWSLTREIIPRDPDWQILKIKCAQELIAENRGRSIRIQIGDRVFELGEVDRRGVAEAEVPSGIDFGQAITVHFGERRRQE